MSEFVSNLLPWLGVIIQWTINGVILIAFPKTRSHGAFLEGMLVGGDRAWLYEDSDGWWWLVMLSEEFTALVRGIGGGGCLVAWRLSQRPAVQQTALLNQHRYTTRALYYLITHTKLVSSNIALQRHGKLNGYLHANINSAQSQPTSGVSVVSALTLRFSWRKHQFTATDHWLVWKCWPLGWVLGQKIGL